MQMEASRGGVPRGSRRRRWRMSQEVLRRARPGSIGFAYKPRITASASKNPGCRRIRHDLRPVVLLPLATTCIDITSPSERCGIVMPERFASKSQASGRKGRPGE
jgi:hypothetical protein